LIVKRVFDRQKIGYEWFDIDKDRQACEYVQQVNGGYKSVPTIVFPDGSVLVEPSNALLEKKLNEIKNSLS
jgi:mycoredoxin